MDFFQIICFKGNKNMVVEKNFRATINFYKKLCLLVFKWNKKHLLMQVVPTTYTIMVAEMLQNTFLYSTFFI